MLTSSAAILAKSYNLPLADMKFLGVELPGQIFDISLLGLVAYFLYAFVISWVGDLMAFRLWYSESSIQSEFGTKMELDGKFISGGMDLLLRLHELEKAQLLPETFDKLDEKTKKLYENFKINCELFSVRLAHAGKSFRTLSVFGHFYIWVQSFVLPVGWGMLAIYLLIKYGAFTFPTRV